MVLLPASSNWLRLESSWTFAATSFQSPGAHCPSAPGSHIHSCGPAVVFRAANSRPFQMATDGKALSAGSRSPVFVVVTDVLVGKDPAGVQLFQLLGAGSAALLRAHPPLLKR